MKLVVGLGNPEERYVGTRHNLGFEALEKYVKETGNENWVMQDKFKAEIIKRGDLIFVKPHTFMNKSGLSVSALVNYYKINPEDVIVIYDELDLPLGKIKVRLGGAAAGHHGVESIIESLGTDKFIRVRLGIGNLRIRSAEKFILEPFMHSEKAQVKHMIKQAIKILELNLKKGIDNKIFSL